MIKTSGKRPHIKLWIAAAVLLVAGILFFSFNVTTVHVTGTTRYTDEEMTKMLFKKRWDTNSIYCYFKDRFAKHQQIPFVEDYKLEFQGPSTVEVIVYEKSVVGYVSYMGSYMYFDKDGIIVESANEKPVSYTHLDVYKRQRVHDEYPAVYPDHWNDLLSGGAVGDHTGYLF